MDQETVKTVQQFFARGMKSAEIARLTGLKPTDVKKALLINATMNERRRIREKLDRESS